MSREYTSSPHNMRFSLMRCLCKDPSAHFFANKDQNAKMRVQPGKTKKSAKPVLTSFCGIFAKKKIPPSRVHSKRKPCIARRYPRLCFALPTSAAVEPRGRPAYLQSNIGFHFIVVGSDMVVYHELSRKVCFQYMRVRGDYALSFRYCRRPRPRRNRRC